MHTVVRTYSGKGAAELIDLIIGNKAAIDALMKSVSGFVSYSVVNTGDGGFTVTVSQSEADSNEITAKARDWVAKNAAHIGANPPAVMGGSVAMQIA